MLDHLLPLGEGFITALPDLIGAMLTWRASNPQSLDGDCIKPKMSPWGVACKNSFHDHLYSDDDLFSLRGHWVRDRAVEQCLSCRRAHISRRGSCCRSIRITAPQRMLLEADFSDVDRSFDIAERVQLYEGDIRQSQSRCMITELPYEILRQILDYFVPSSCVYQFIPSRKRGSPIQVVQQFVPTGYQYPSVMLAIAASCQVLHQRICEILYGENKFVFNISTESVVAQSDSGDFQKFDSWSRILQRRPGPFGPITGRAASFMTHATLIIILPLENSEREIELLHLLLRQTVVALERCYDMKRLTVDFELPRRLGGDTGALKVDRVQLDLDTDGVEKWVVRVRGPASIPTWRLLKAHRALEPLLDLDVIGDAVLQGMTCETFAKELRAVVADK